MELIIKKTKKPNQTMGGRPKQTSLQSRHTDGQNALKRCSTSLIIRDMQIKSIMRHHLTPGRTAIIKKQEITKVDKEVEIREPLCTVGGNVYWCSQYGKQYVRKFGVVQLLSRVQLFVTRGLHHSRPPCPSPTPRVYSNSCPSSQWCHPTI